MRCIRSSQAPIAALAIAAILCAGCGGSQFASAPFARSSSLVSRASGSSPIQHIVLIVQENRSFDDFFATFPGVDGTTTGKLGAKTIKLKQASLTEGCDFGHSRQGYNRDYDSGKMDGFYLEGGIGLCPKKAGNRPYQYVNPKQIAPYWDIARHYVIADHMFQTQGSGSFTAHQDLIRGGTSIDQAQRESLVDFPDHSPWGCDAPKHTDTSLVTFQPGRDKLTYGRGPFPCSKNFPDRGQYYPTMRDVLDAKSVSWKYYVAPISSKGSGNLWNAFDLVAAVRYGPEWYTNISSPETNVLTDISSGQLAAMSWVIPDLQNSDHPSSLSDKGPSWVASIVNAIGESQYWQNTAIVIVWDDWGGFYDHVPPPFFDRWGGLGFRVPMLVVCAYNRRQSATHPGYVAHEQFEFGSILKFVEETYGLGSLETTDARALSIGAVLDFGQKPRAFKKIPTKYSRAYFEHQKPSYRPLDDE